MSQYAGGERDRYQRFYEQLAEIEERLKNSGQLGTELVVEPPEAGPGTGTAPRYLYEARRLYCSDQSAELFARDRLPGPCDVVDSGRNPEVPRRLEVVEDVHIPAEVDRLNAEVRAAQPDRAGAPAYSPHHLVSIATNPVTICPADEPKPVPRTADPWPPKASSGGANVRVLIVDTGLPPDGHPWRGRGVEPYDEDGQPYGGWNVPLNEETGLIQQYAGHGAFVTGVLKNAAPDAQVMVSNALVHGGAALEDSLGTVLLDLVTKQGWPDIISLSAGGTSHRNRDLLGLQEFLAQLAQQPGTLLVAAAGNDGNRDNLFFPAALADQHDGVISVGALRRNERGRTCFSNYGSTVTVFAPGEHHVNTFLTGQYAYQHPREPECRYYQPALFPDCTCLGEPDFGTLVQFYGMARWSGTSYATPLVAGMIARQMSEKKINNAREAADDLFAKRRETITDVDGEVLPVLRLSSTSLA